MVSVPRRWPGETVVCIGTGPSLTAEDVNAVRGQARVIAVNDAYRLAPWADALYACDVQWWKWHHGVPSFTGEKWSLKVSGWRHASARYPDVQLLTNTGKTGLETDPTGLRTGKNSGYQAINLAVHYGAKRIVLLGYDMKLGATGAHFFGEHPGHRRGPYRTFIPCFSTLVAPLHRLGVEVINCTRDTALDAFPKAPLAQVLRVEVAA
jgi:hypothetical protein